MAQEKLTVDPNLATGKGGKSAEEIEAEKAQQEVDAVKAKFKAKHNRQLNQNQASKVLSKLKDKQTQQARKAQHSQLQQKQFAQANEKQQTASRTGAHKAIGAQQAQQANETGLTAEQSVRVATHEEADPQLPQPNSKPTTPEQAEAILRKVFKPARNQDGKPVGPDPFKDALAQYKEGKAQQGQQKARTGEQAGGARGRGAQAQAQGRASGRQQGGAGVSQRMGMGAAAGQRAAGQQQGRLGSAAQQQARGLAAGRSHQGVAPQAKGQGSTGAGAKQLANAGAAAKRGAQAQQRSAQAGKGKQPGQAQRSAQAQQRGGVRGQKAQRSSLASQNSGPGGTGRAPLDTSVSRYNALAARGLADTPDGSAAGRVMISSLLGGLIHLDPEAVTKGMKHNWDADLQAFVMKIMIHMHKHRKASKHLRFKQHQLAALGIDMARTLTEMDQLWERTKKRNAFIQSYQNIQKARRTDATAVLKGGGRKVDDSHIDEESLAQYPQRKYNMAQNSLQLQDIAGEMRERAIGPQRSDGARLTNVGPQRSLELDDDDQDVLRGILDNEELSAADVEAIETVLEAFEDDDEVQFVDQPALERTAEVVLALVATDRDYRNCGDLSDALAQHRDAQARQLALGEKLAEDYINKSNGFTDEDDDGRLIGERRVLLTSSERRQLSPAEQQDYDREFEQFTRRSGMLGGVGALQNEMHRMEAYRNRFKRRAAETSNPEEKARFEWMAGEFERKARDFEVDMHMYGHEAFGRGTNKEAWLGVGGHMHNDLDAWLDVMRDVPGGRREGQSLEVIALADKWADEHNGEIDCKAVAEQMLGEPKWKPEEVQQELLKGSSAKPWKRVTKAQRQKIDDRVRFEKVDGSDDSLIMRRKFEMSAEDKQIAFRVRLAAAQREDGLGEIAVHHLPGHKEHNRLRINVVADRLVEADAKIKELRPKVEEAMRQNPNWQDDPKSRPLKDEWHHAMGDMERLEQMLEPQDYDKPIGQVEDEIANAATPEERDKLEKKHEVLKDLRDGVRGLSPVGKAERRLELAQEASAAEPGNRRLQREVEAKENDLKQAKKAVSSEFGGGTGPEVAARLAAKRGGTDLTIEEVGADDTATITVEEVSGDDDEAQLTVEEIDSAFKDVGDKDLLPRQDQQDNLAYYAGRAQAVGFLNKKAFNHHHYVGLDKFLRIGFDPFVESVIGSDMIEGATRAQREAYGLTSEASEVRGQINGHYKQVASFTNGMVSRLMEMLAEGRRMTW